ncbi:YggT family protein [Thiomicrorhabdus sp. ZW0627]|uniref:YggT family protein n=1 Tax=Thiomicrorhabdus sp. ZW0627 TaxID=3039774 RepID=UPI00243661A2|nr:YggT family protein [Thiomicrorhabdus sp. ZW0627]MDG6773787.1 YggT family protein [Thiomicrorhabdus sp. ZW0627]
MDNFSSPIGQGGLYLLQFLVGLVIFALMLRFLLRATHADWRHPIVQFIAKITNPLCALANKIVPTRGRWDWAAIITALVIHAIFVWGVGMLTGRDFGAVAIALASVTEILNQLLDMMFWLIIIQVILSWVSPGYNPNMVIFNQLTNPILAPFQRFIPPIGGMDLSPLAAILAIKLFQIVVVGSIAQIAQGFL